MRAATLAGMVLALLVTSCCGSPPQTLQEVGPSAAATVTATAAPAPEPALPAAEWSEEVRGLKSRLVSDRTRYESSQNIWLYLDVRNVSQKEIQVARGGFITEDIELVGPDGKRVPVVEKDLPAPWSFELPAGRFANAEFVYCRRAYGFLPPGKYRARWVGPAESPLFETRVPPTSNAIEFAVLPSETQKDAGKPERDVPFGAAQNDLATRLYAEQPAYRAGQPIRMRLEIQNTGKVQRAFHMPQVSVNGRIIVRDGQGKDVPFLGLTAQTTNPLERLNAGERLGLDWFDLAACYYLRKPGRYTAQFPGERSWGSADDEFGGEPDLPVPASNKLAFEVIADPAGTADGDPVGRLLGAVPEGWNVNAQGFIAGLVRPEGNWGRVRGKVISVWRHRPQDKGVTSVRMYLTEAAATAELWVAEPDAAPCEYLGKGPAGHVYAAISAEAAQAWPATREALRTALVGE